MRSSRCILPLFILLGPPTLSAQPTGCHLAVRAEDNGLLSINGKPLGPAVVSSDTVTVPSFHLRFVDGSTGSLLKPSEVSIAYGWRWFQYPYPEHSWGAWSAGSDLVSCAKLEATE